MIKKDYERAALIAQTYAEHYEDACEHGVVIRAFARLFQEDDPRFDADRFRAACQPGMNVEVRACNNHEALVAALQQAYGAMCEPHGEWKDVKENRALIEVREALAAVEKEE